MRGKLLLSLVVIWVMIVGPIFPSFVTEGLLRLEGYVRDYQRFSHLASLIGTPASSCFI
jgi:hypothetical protein